MDTSRVKMSRDIELKVIAAEEILLDREKLRSRRKERKDKIRHDRSKRS